LAFFFGLDQVKNGLVFHGVSYMWQISEEC
jgi:hypothetical protein